MQTLDYVAEAGHRLGHYRILEQIGAGGMGVVYRTHDEHLDREVAIKVLPPGTVKDETARKRFRSEAHALSKLNHPNIATVHDFDSQGEVDYLVMEYLPGETLRDRISAGALPEDEIIRLSIQLAKGLTAVHHHRVVHCDLKPENVRLMPDGRVKILDFGLSKLIRNPLDPSITASTTLSIAGTLPYMSPELVSGGQVDERVDMFSLGVVLYEMATAQRPFSGIESCNVIAAILQKEPIPPRSLNPKVSPGLEQIILRCLEKKPADRYQSAKQVMTGLRRAAMARNTALDPLAARLRRLSRTKIGAFALILGFLVLAAAIVVRSRSAYALSASDSIVLSNFVNSTWDPVFDEALNQALTVELEQSPYLNIVSQTRVRETLRLMGRSQDEVLTPELGRELCERVSAKAVLWGSISTLGKHYVIGLNAVECGSGNYLATEQIQSADKEDVLKALGRAATRLRSRLGESLSSVQRFDAPLDQATTPSLDALKAYSLGRKAEYREGSMASIPFFRRAVELDPNFAVAYAALGIAYSNLGEPGLANTNLQRAYELRDRVSERERSYVFLPTISAI
jgi:eukaryotic-like serine/threonine-protein kinase